MVSDLLLFTFKFKILSFFYSFFCEQLNPPPVDFSSLFVFSSRSSLSSLSMSFSESFGHVYLFDSLIFLFLVSEASIPLDFGFSIFFFQLKSFDEIPKSFWCLPGPKSTYFLDIFSWLDREFKTTHHTSVIPNPAILVASYDQITKPSLHINKHIYPWNQPFQPEFIWVLIVRIPFTTYNGIETTP